jgi:hypothetical protein
MTKKIITFITTVLLYSLSTLAQESYKNSPFSPDAESYLNIIKNNFESLPNVTDLSKIEGTEKTAEAQTQKRLTGKIYRPYFTGNRYNEGKIIGKLNITAKGPATDAIIETSIIKYNKKYYFWIITGEVQYYQRKPFTNKNEKYNEKFFYVIHFENNRWQDDCLFISNEKFDIDDKIQNIVSKTVEPLLKQKNKNLYEIAIKKEKWTFNNRETKGKLVNYENGKVHILGNIKKPFEMDVTKFSIDDQIIIKGYIDHLGIPTREKQDKKSR